MDKLNKMVEAVVEKTVGRFLPEVEAKAGCSWEYQGCCAGNQAKNQYICRNPDGSVYHYGTTTCTGLCPQ